MTDTQTAAVGATMKPSSLAIRGGGWVFDPTEDGYRVHRESVDPESADAGEVLYIAADELFGFVACVDFSAEVFDPSCGSLSPMSPVDFVRSGDEKPVFSTFGAAPVPGTVVTLPDGMKLRVVRLEVHYLSRGQRRSLVVCE